MPRECAQCGDFSFKAAFSTSQWRKGIGESRCEDCVGATQTLVSCDECGKWLPDDNALKMHKRKHQERTFACPGCDKMYRGLTDTALHFESGSCTACKGQDNARRAAYQLVAQRKGGANFLTNPLMLTDGDGGGGYSEEGPNYRCPSCPRTFKLVSALMQHQQSTACLSAGRQVNLRLGNGVQHAEVQKLKFFHGTTWRKANEIHSNGFIPSSGGCLGHGIYVAREEKATRFARLRAEETGQGGGLVEVVVSVSNPKMVMYNDSCWQDEGYDACRAEKTSASTNMEWCILHPSQIQVVRISWVN